MTTTKLQKQPLIAVFVLTILLIQSFKTIVAVGTHQQVHLALGTNETEMLVTWSTLWPLKDDAYVLYGLEEKRLNQSSKAEVSLYGKISLYTYRALLTGLSPLTKYYYRVGSNGSLWSAVFTFRSLSDSPSWMPTLALYGDLGYQRDESLPYLAKEVRDRDLYSAIFHVGDFAYDLYQRGGRQGNDFMNSIERVAARVPYITCPGNHERHDNFSHYDSRFSMLGDRHQPAHASPLLSRLNNHFHSMDIGPAHIVLLSTEYYYYTSYGWEQIARQYEWLEQDLARANANRAQRPWIIALYHKPLYCFNVLDHTCNQLSLDRPKIRQGVRWPGTSRWAPLKYGLEDLFYRHGVDLTISGHEHFYVRNYPMYLHEMRAKHEESPYDNPKGIVHITSGSAGNREFHPPLHPLFRFQKWTAEHYYDFGYTRLKFLGRLKMAIEQTSTDKGGRVIDRIELTKSAERPAWMK